MLNKKKALSISLLISVIIMLGKLSAWYITSSNAILSDALESFVNVAAGAFALFSVSLAALPKDTNHPYGHGKVEFLSAGLEGLMISVAGLLILLKAAYNLIHPQTLQSIDIGIAIIAITGLVNFSLSYYLKKVNKEFNSIAIEANSKHLLADAITSAGLLFGLIILLLFQVTWVDNLMAIAFGAYIFTSGIKLIRKSVAGVMDEADTEIIKEIIGILNKSRKDNWVDIHNFRVIKYGNDLHIDCHMTLPWYYDLRQCHEELKELEEKILKPLKNKIEVFIHADPCIPSSCKICSLATCPVRQHPFEKRIVWNLSNVVSNKKHDILTPN
jgi:cation diffusion facilitator family transporter